MVEGGIQQHDFRYQEKKASLASCGIIDLAFCVSSSQGSFFIDENVLGYVDSFFVCSFFSHIKYVASY